MRFRHSGVLFSWERRERLGQEKVEHWGKREVTPEVVWIHQAPPPSCGEGWGKQMVHRALLPFQQGFGSCAAPRDFAPLVSLPPSHVLILFFSRPLPLLLLLHLLLDAKSWKQRRGNSHSVTLVTHGRRTWKKGTLYFHQKYKKA